MQEIVIISGKGGTGKTTVASSLSIVARKEAIIADCDVDAANMYLLLQPDIQKMERFFSGELAEINQEFCNKCGLCKDICRFNAIKFENDQYIVNELDCEGCGYCELICPVKAIKMSKRASGMVYNSIIKTNSIMVHAKLFTGAENSGKLVAKVKNEAKQIAINEEVKNIIVDGSPGIGCPVISSLSGASHALIVTEPTLSGLHDLKRICEIAEKFHIKTACIINKFDINIENTNEIKKYLKKNHIEHILDIPYDKIFNNSIIEGKTIAEYSPKYFEIFSNLWDKLKN